jgi:acetoacetyl-CoA reductase
MERKTAFVTGGARGIGADIVRGLLNDGHNVIAAYQSNTERAEAFAAETGAKVVKLDVRDFEACGTVVQNIIDEHGRIDILVNNAGITKDTMAHKMSAEDWHNVIDTNLSSCFYLCRHILPSMRQNMFGRIINISSINGQKGQLGQANYAASKAGMIGLTKSIALENAAKNITANVICPGYIETEMTASMPQDILQNIVANIPVGRMGNPNEIASLVSFLASDHAAFMTGAVVPINGGQFMGG